jgi:hypothetical protein
MGAFKSVVCLSFHLIKMAVPPLVPALIATEAPFSPLRYLLNLPPAVIAESRFNRSHFKEFAGCIRIDVFPSTE